MSPTCFGASVLTIFMENKMRTLKPIANDKLLFTRFFIL